MMFCEIIATIIDTQTLNIISFMLLFLSSLYVNTTKHKLFVFLFTFFVVFEIYSMLGYDVEFGLIILIFVDFLPQSIPLSFSATVSNIHFLLVFNFFLSVLCT